MADHATRPGTSGIQASKNYAAVTPNNGVDLPFITRALHIGGAGTLAVVCPDTGATISFTVVAGQILPIQTARVMSTGTTATLIVALF